jgi:hypothetical protein
MARRDGAGAFGDQAVLAREVADGLSDLVFGDRDQRADVVADQAGGDGGGWLTDFALGGLNYQIEHHLFPSMPRPSLRRAQEPVRAFCDARGVAYRQTGLFASYAQVLRHLHTVGGSLRPELEY